jgi:Lrp/AsnC family transcriptional regulator, leucine-responsive regulatory protein
MLLPKFPPKGTAMASQAPIIDPTDKRILAILQEDGRRKNTELADAINMTPAPCLRRVKELEQSGVIRKYVALVEPRLVGLNLTALIEVKLVSQTQPRLESFERAVSRLPNVLECFLVTGEWDYVLKVVASDLDEYQQFLVTKLTSSRDIQSLKSTIVMKSVKQTTALQVP